MSPDRQPSLTPQAVLGVIIALLGVIFTLDNLGLANADVALRYWPLALVAVGVAICMHAAQTRDWIFGVLWMVGGSLLLARNLEWITVQPRKLLPLLLVVLGARLIWRPAPRPRPVTPPPIPEMPAGLETPAEPFDRAWTGENPTWSQPGQSAPAESSASGSTASGRHRASKMWPHFCAKDGRINVFAILGGVERRLRSEVFTGAELTAIMGGCELDLREARMGGDEAHIAAFALWGGIEIRVPREWLVLNESSALMGGVDDATRPHPGANRPRLVVRGFALMGGIEIKN